MRPLALAGVLVSLAVCSAIAPAQTTSSDPVIAPIHAFMEAFNKGDAAAAAATHVKTAELDIVDEVPPYHWHGPDAFTAWSAALDADSKKQAITEARVSIGAPIRKLTEGGSAYVIVPAVYRFKQGGVAMRQAAQMTFTLAKEASGWKIQSWTWTGPGSRPASKPKT
jgi:hypothetical protein